MRLSLTRAVLPFLLVSALFILHALSFGPYIADDAGISLAYARNLAEGNGLVLTAGGERVEGYSNPLWVLILALAVLAGADTLNPEMMFKALGMALALGTIALVAATGRTYDTHGRSLLHWFAPVLIAVSASFTFWAVAGLENALYAFLIVASVMLYLRDIGDRRWRAGPVWSALALTGVALTRPEGVAVFAAFAVHRVIVVAAARGGRAAAGRRFALWAVLFCALFGAFLLWRYWYFGAWLPNTYHAKLSDRHLSRLPEYLATVTDPGWKYLGGYVAEAGALVVILAVAGLLDLRRWRVNLLLAGVLATVALFVIYAGGDWWPVHRFISPAVPLLALAAQHGVIVLVRTLRRRAAAAAVGLAIAAAIPGNAAATGVIWSRDDESLIGLRSRLAQGVRIRAFADAAHVTDPLYLDPDIGGPSLAGLRILDLGMLTDVHLARFHYYPPFFREYVFEEQRPAFVRTHSVWTRLSRLTEYPEFARDYLPITSHRDGYYGLSGEFVRKDLFVSRHPVEAAVPLARWSEIVLHEFEPEVRTLAPGVPLTFRWTWSCAPVCAADYSFHVRLEPRETAVLTAADASGERPVASVRHYRPVFGWYPTTSWQRGEIIRTTQDVALPRVASGEFDVSVAAAGPHDQPVFAKVATIRVSSAAAVAPAARQSPAARPDPDLDALLQHANESFTRGLYDDAMKGYRAVLALEPGMPRVRRRLEDARERSHWIEYLYDTDQFDRLRALYASGALAGARGERELKEDLAILRDAKPVIFLHEDGEPALALLRHRLVTRDGDIDHRVRLYFKVLRAPRRNYQVWLHASPPDAPERLRTWGMDTRTPSRRWTAGEERVITLMFNVPAGEYNLRAGFWQPSGSGRLCPSERECYLALGTHRLGQ